MESLFEKNFLSALMEKRLEDQSGKGNQAI
jgi:hypothetical protein